MTILNDNLDKLLEGNFSLKFIFIAFKKDIENLLELLFQFQEEAHFHLNTKAERTKKNNRPFRANPTARTSLFKTRLPVHHSPPNKSHRSPAKSPPDRALHLVDDEPKTLRNPPKSS